jgi:hypothetical protein
MAPRDNIEKADLRRRPRLAATGMVRIAWPDSTGVEKVCIARKTDWSEIGLRLRADQPIPPRSHVHCNDPKEGGTRRGWVRYCNFRKGAYELGIELA